ncbi:MAG: ribosome silencing factor [Flavobacteriales bacterium]|nr:ribosome silencing factor [Flavobacteriales bacterium]
MAKKKKVIDEVQQLVEVAIKGLEETKAVDIVTIDLRNIETKVCDFFIICTGTSNTHVGALARSCEEEIRKTLGEKPWHSEGFGNAEWILIDYVTVVIHIFQEEARNFYNIEGLWADAKIQKI